jgi:polar amino acid transport system substrate-binding protein
MKVLGWILGAVLLISGCAAPTPAAVSTPTPTPTPTPTVEVEPEGRSLPSNLDECAPQNLTTIRGGKLTIGTDTPAYPPYFVDDDPTNGEGFESAVAYAIADGLGFEPKDVLWQKVPFNAAYAPGPKEFDFDINQISITEKREQDVEFSQPYYDVNFAVVALRKSSIADAASIDDLREARLGVLGSNAAGPLVNEIVQPTQSPQLFTDTTALRSALKAGVIDGVVVDLPTAYYLTAVELPRGKIVGQFPARAGDGGFGLVFQQGNPLVRCVDRVLDQLKASGELQDIQDRWLAGDIAPYFGP